MKIVPPFSFLLLLLIGKSTNRLIMSLFLIALSLSLLILPCEGSKNCEDPNNATHVFELVDIISSTSTSSPYSFDRIETGLYCPGSGDGSKLGIPLQLHTVPDANAPVRITVTPPNLVVPVVENGVLKFHYAAGKDLAADETITTGINMTVPRGLLKHVYIPDAAPFVSLALMDDRIGVEINSTFGQVEILNTAASTDLFVGSTSTRIYVDGDVANIDAVGEGKIYVRGDVLSGRLAGRHHMVVVGSPTVDLEGTFDSVLVNGGTGCDRVTTLSPNVSQWCHKTAATVRFPTNCFPSDRFHSGCDMRGRLPTVPPAAADGNSNNSTGLDDDAFTDMTMAQTSAAAAAGVLSYPSSSSLYCCMIGTMQLFVFLLIM